MIMRTKNLFLINESWSFKQSFDCGEWDLKMEVKEKFAAETAEICDKSFGSSQ